MPSTVTIFFANLAKRFKALGALPTARVTWGLVALFCVWIVLDMNVLKLTSGLAQTTYDAMVRNRFHAAAPDPRLVVVDIDEASLSRMSKEFGRWPWPRDTLASVQDFIEREGPLAIVWDITFSDADRLSPGGDAAFNASSGSSPHSHYSVIRLPAHNDRLSELTHAHLPSLWARPPASKPSTIALIAPVLPNVASGKLGYNNGYSDSDGVLRRYRYSENLADGSIIQSTPLSVVRSVTPDLTSQVLDLPKVLDKLGADRGTLVAWRKAPDIYPKISFADVFAKAEGANSARAAAVPSFRGKVVVIGSTAPSLHDIHPTPLAPFQAGVESLATVIDNGMNARFITEVPRWIQALLAMAFCALLAVWVRRFGIASLDGALVMLPGALLGIGYLSLNGSPIFLDLQLPAGAVLVFLAALRTWNNFRRNHWCELPSTKQSLFLMSIQHLRHKPFVDAGLDHLIDLLERHAPACRILGGDTTATWPSKLRWPELACYVAVVGPSDQLENLKAVLPTQIATGHLQALPQPLKKSILPSYYFKGQS